MLLLWDLLFEIAVPSSAAGSLACPAFAQVKDTLFLPAAAAAEEINAAPANGLSLSAAGLLPARTARAAGCAGNRDTCLRSLRCRVEPEGSGKTKGFCGRTARGDVGGWRGGGVLQSFSTNAFQS